MNQNNLQILLGNLVADPTSRVAGESTVTNFRVATNGGYRDRNGDWVEDTQYHNVEAWGYLSEKASGLEKGNQVYVMGETRHKKYTKDGQDRYFTSVKAHNLETFGKKARTEEESPDDEFPF